MLKLAVVLKYTPIPSNLYLLIYKLVLILIKVRYMVKKANKEKKTPNH